MLAQFAKPLCSRSFSEGFRSFDVPQGVPQGSSWHCPSPGSHDFWCSRFHHRCTKGAPPVLRVLVETPNSRTFARSLSGPGPVWTSCPAPGTCVRPGQGLKGFAATRNLKGKRILEYQVRVGALGRVESNKFELIELDISSPDVVPILPTGIRTTQHNVCCTCIYVSIYIYMYVLKHCMGTWKNKSELKLQLWIPFFQRLV